MKNEYFPILQKIKNALINDVSEHHAWNANYFDNAKERYISDVEYVRSLGEIQNILEIGAAPFHLSLFLKELGYNSTILDLEPNRFRWFIDKNKLNVIKTNIETERFPVKSNSFDLVMLTEVFEHLRINPIDTLSKMHSALKPDGLLYLTTPNFYRFTNINSFIKGKPVVNAFYEFNKLNTIGHMGHVREYSKDEVKLFLENTGFQVINFAYHNAITFSKFSKYGVFTSLFNGTKTHMKFLAKKIS